MHGHLNVYMYNREFLRLKLQTRGLTDTIDSVPFYIYIYIYIYNVVVYRKLNNNTTNCVSHNTTSSHLKTVAFARPSLSSLYQRRHLN
jgi:hypothetical protein